jgi:hypothetical protein
MYIDKNYFVLIVHLDEIIYFYLLLFLINYFIDYFIYIYIL